MNQRSYIALDLETTGLNPRQSRIIEIGAVRFCDGQIVDRFESLVNPQQPIPPQIQRLTGISNRDVENAPPLETVLPRLRDFVDIQAAGTSIHGIVAHNAKFDLGFLRAAGLTFGHPALDTVELASVLLPSQASYNLGQLCLAEGIPLTNAHRALADAEATAHLFMRLKEHIMQLPHTVVDAIIHFGTYSQSPALFPLDVVEPDHWPLLRLFQEFAAQQKSHRASTNGRQPESVAHHSSAKGDDNQELNTAMSLTGEEFIAHLLGKDGALASVMGSQFELRNGQIAMAKRVWQAIASADHLLIEAETGTGKSLAYLIAASLWAMDSGERVVIATNTLALQDQLAAKEIPQLEQIMAAIPYERYAAFTSRNNVRTQNRTTVISAVLKGRENYLCLRRLHAWCHARRLAPTEMRFLAKMLVWLHTTKEADRSDLRLLGDEERQLWQQICSDGSTCSIERCLGLTYDQDLGANHIRKIWSINNTSPDAGEVGWGSINNTSPDAGEAGWGSINNTSPDAGEAGWGSINNISPDFYLAAHQRATEANLIVINHALLIADLASGGRILPQFSRLIVDEGHRLDEAATQQLTYEADWRSARQQLSTLDPNSHLLNEIVRLATPRLAERLRERLHGMDNQIEHTINNWDRFLVNLESVILQLDSVQPNRNYAQRIRVDGGLRSQPLWSQIEIDWESLSLRIGQLVEWGHRIANQLEEVSWFKAEPHAMRLSQLRGEIDALNEFVTQMNALIFGTAANSGSSVGWFEIARSQDGYRNTTAKSFHHSPSKRTSQSQSKSRQGGAKSERPIAPAHAIGLRIAPVQVNTILEELLIQEKKSVIVTGATLRTGVRPYHQESAIESSSPHATAIEQEPTNPLTEGHPFDIGFDYIKNQLGLWDAPTAIITSSFDYRENVLLMMPKQIPQPNSPNYQSAVEQAIIAAASASNHTLVLFTSFSHVRTTGDAIRQQLTSEGIDLLAHTGRSSGRRRLLQGFRQSKRAVLLATRTFWEGIDLPGDEVETLIIVRLPFSVPDDPLIGARSAISLSENENPFETIQLPDAILKFRQGFGRLIRRQSDRGTVLLLDSRIWQKSYGQMFLDALPSCTEKKCSIDEIGAQVEEWQLAGQG